MALTNGFTAYPDYWQAIEHFDDDIKAKICLAMVQYGLTEELPDAATNPIGYGMVMGWKRAIDNSIDNHKKAAQNGNKGGRPPKNDYSELTEMRKQGIKAEDAAKKYGVSKDTIYNRPEWKAGAPSKEVEDPVPVKPAPAAFNF